MLATFIKTAVSRAFLSCSNPPRDYLHPGLYCSVHIGLPAMLQCTHCTVSITVEEVLLGYIAVKCILIQCISVCSALQYIIVQYNVKPVSSGVYSHMTAI